MRSLNQQEIQLIKTNLKNPRDYCLFVLGYRTGFRISELLSFDIKSVYSNGKVRESVKVWRKNMKGGISSREVLLHQEARLAIQKYVDTLIVTDTNDKLFKSKKGGSIGRSRAIGIIKEVVQKLDLQGSIATHSMRKSFSKNVYKASGNNLLIVQKALGHSSIMSTVKYLSVTQEEVDKIIMELE